jgi:Ca-activated chloride channel family protein
VDTERTRAGAPDGRESGDLEDKGSKLYQKISKPELTNFKLHVDQSITLSEVYPGQLPDLFHGNQLVILGRYRGKGETTVRLTGMVGKEEREFVYRVRFPAQTKQPRDFVEELWARRKVGYLLTQIRVNGDNRELVEEVVALAKKYGITTPYTSYLVAPDAPTSLASAPAVRRADQNADPFVNRKLNRASSPTSSPAVQTAGQGGTSSATTAAPMDWVQYYKDHSYTITPANGSAMPANSYQRIQFQPVFVSPSMTWGVPATMAAPPGMPAPGYSTAPVPAAEPAPLSVARNRVEGTFDDEQEEEREAVPSTAAPCPSGNCTSSSCTVPHSGSQAVDYAIVVQDLQRQNQVTTTAVKRVAGHSFRQVGGFWVDEAFKKNMTVVAIKAQGAAYFDILQKHPEVRDVFLLGNQVKWVTPGGLVLVIAADAGQDSLSADEIDALFARK